MPSYRRYLLVVIVILTCTVGESQQRPDILLEDVQEQLLHIKCYCKPGVRNRTRSKGVELSYQYLGSGVIRPANGEFGDPFPEYQKFRKFKSKLSIPILVKTRLRSVIGVSYVAEQFELMNSGNDFEDLILGLDNQNFKTARIDIAVSYSINEKNYVGGRFATSFKGNYEGLLAISNRYAVYSGAIAYGIKKSEDNEWGFGIAGSRNFRSQGFRALPFVFWNKTINDKWGYQITFPSSYNMRYNANEKTILVANTHFNSESYSYDQLLNNNRSIAFNHSEIQTSLKMERQIIPWLWFDVSVGYRYNFNTNFELQNENSTLLEVDPGNSLTLKIGLFISPPDSFLDK